MLRIAPCVSLRLSSAARSRYSRSSSDQASQKSWNCSRNSGETEAGGAPTGAGRTGTPARATGRAATRWRTLASPSDAAPALSARPTANPSTKPVPSTNSSTQSTKAPVASRRIPTALARSSGARRQGAARTVPHSTKAPGAQQDCAPAGPDNGSPAAGSGTACEARGRGLSFQQTPRAPPAVMRRGVGRGPMDDAAFRLPRHVRPERYTLHLEPDLADWTFTGREAIEVHLARATRQVALHAVDLAVTEAWATVGGRRWPCPATVEPQPAREAVVLRFAEPLPAGRATLHLAFRGTIGTGLRGLYRAEVDGRRYAFTQFEATDARRAFPCFDEPAFKARFDLSATVPADLVAISNGAPLREAPGAEPGTKTVTFATTPRMSTYLVALAVGALEPTATALARGGTPIRVWTVPGKTGMGGLALEAAVASLNRLERYFGVRYPYGKLDLLAVPDFEAGAMENSGAIFFRETALLCDPATASVAAQKRIALVVAHEIAHQWFGNLVTMQWWDDLWLNEAFATWIEFRTIDDWRPEWEVWVDFQQEKAAPFATDALASTRPIRATVKNPAQISEMFDAITYEKGAAVLRMLEHYLGPAVFRAGVRQYIRAHREGNATAADLFGALEAASGRRVRAIARDWIDQPGYPVLRATLTGREAPAGEGRGRRPPR